MAPPPSHAPELQAIELAYYFISIHGTYLLPISHGLNHQGIAMTNIVKGLGDNHNSIKEYQRGQNTK